MSYEIVLDQRNSSVKYEHSSLDRSKVTGKVEAYGQTDIPKTISSQSFSLSYIKIGVSDSLTFFLH